MLFEIPISGLSSTEKIRVVEILIKIVDATQPPTLNFLVSLRDAPRNSCTDGCLLYKYAQLFCPLPPEAVAKRKNRSVFRPIKATREDGGLLRHA